MFDSAGERECVHVFDNVVIGQFVAPDGELKRFSKELTLAERTAIDRDPSLISSPGTFLHQLAQAAGTQVEGVVVATPGDRALGARSRSAAP